MVAEPKNLTIDKIIAMLLLSLDQELSAKVLRNFNDDTVDKVTRAMQELQEMAIDRETGVVFANEHGALGGDELNRIEPGANYGWPKVSWSREYVGAAQVGSGRSDAAYTDPLLVWETAMGPSGLMVYRGSQFKDWQGKVFSGSLVKQDVRVLTLDEAGAVAREETLRFGARVRDVREGPDGAIYVLTDERNGRLFKLTPAAPPPAG